MRPVLVVLVAALAAAPAAADTFVVLSPFDTGGGTLRAAIEAANATPPGPHVIHFNLPGPGVHRIQLQTPLPEVLVPLLIDGYSQPGARPNQLAVGSDAVILVELDGSALTDSNGLVLRGGASTVRGLALVGFPTGFSALAFRLNDGDAVEGCFIGLGADGDTSRPNYDGVATLGAAASRVGGPDPAQRNVISNNSNRGIVFDTADNVIQGNLIGLHPSGTAVRPNGSGVFFLCAGALTCNDNLIGGTGAGEANVVSGNVFSGINFAASLSDVTPTGNRIVGNLVGLDASGLVALPNQIRGLGAEAVDDTVIRGNTVVGGGFGIVVVLDSRGTEIEGNRIGTDVNGVPLLGPTTAGIEVASGAQQTRIGGTAAGQSNLIGPGPGTGVLVAGDDVQGVAILGNSISGHGGLAVDLVGGAAVQGPDANDPLDADPGPNLIQNHPEILDVRRVGADWELDLRLESAPATTYRVEVFANRACNPAGYGEAETLLTAFALNTDGNGLAATTLSVTPSPGTAVLAATATDPDGNTSELSPCRGPLEPAIPALDHRGLVMFTLLLGLVGLWIVSRAQRQA